MRSRKLRIASSVICSLLAVLFVALWLRSYERVDGVQDQLTANYTIGFGSLPGSIAIRFARQPMRASLPRWSLTTIETDRWLDAVQRNPGFHPSRRWGMFLMRGSMIAVPSWFAVAITTAAAVIPWVRWKFSLRAMFVATTIVAVALGSIAYVTNR